MSSSVFRQDPLHVVVLAAGRGQRMAGTLPKVLQPLAGQPLVAHVVATLRTLQPHDLVVVAGVHREAIAATLPADARIVIQPEPLGTGDAARVGLDGLESPGIALVALADVPLVMAQSHRQAMQAAAGGALALLTTTPPDPTGYGRIVRDAHDQVQAIVEERVADAQQKCIAEIFVGGLAAPAALLQDWLGRLQPPHGEYLLTDVVALARHDGVPVVAVAIPPEEACGINDMAQLAHAERIMQRRIVQDLMRRGVRLADPERLDVRGQVTTGRNVVLDVGVVLEGEVHLEDDVRIGPYVVIRDSTIGAGSTILPFSHVEGAVLHQNVRVGPMARLRPGARLHDGVRVGNFVEVKAATLHNHVQANHLSYLGDAEVGAATNIGAGTITCNYDGHTKHRTVIGERVFVGSGTELVAPVSLGDASTIAAGSTVTHDVPAESLCVARTRQRLIPGWARRTRRRKG